MSTVLVPAAKSGLNTNARFWLIGANPNFSDLSSLKAVVSGIAIGYAPGEGGEPADQFDGLEQAPLILPGDKGTRYELRAHSLNSIHEGSIILFHGQAIGKVIEIQFEGNHGFRLHAIATAMLYPQQMHLKTGASAQSASDDWRAATDAALTRLIHLGYRARLQQSPPVLGDQSIQLVHMVGAPAAQLITDGSNPRFPSAPGSSDLDDIASKADVFLNKLDAVPLEDIGANLRKITGNLDKLMSSPELKDSLTHLHSTLTSIDKLLGDVQPQIGPLVGKLHDAAAELSGTATALRQLVESGGPNADASLPDAIRQITEAAAQIARQTLSDDLDQRLPSGSVIYPRLPKPDSALSISVDILEFTVVASQASMRASWLIVPAAGSQSAKRSVASLQGPMTSAEPAAVAHAWSELIGQLADRIAADVASFKIP